jgi:pimeloyl-ACP methyl ester carboxylesterase
MMYIAEAILAESIERWRKAQGIEKLIVLGHSLGGYVAAEFALRHPDHVEHVILADAWCMGQDIGMRRCYQYIFYNNVTR